MMEKHCHSCKFGNLHDDEEPCCRCDVIMYRGTAEIATHSNWQSKDENEMKVSAPETKKTKAQLMEELEQKNAEIAELKKELERSANYEQYLDAAKEMRSMVDAFVESGFNEAQAFSFVVTMVGNAALRKHFK